MACNLPAPSSASGQFNGTTIQLSWSAVSGAEKYRVVVTDKDTDTELFNESVEGTAVNVPDAIANHNYRFSVNAVCEDGETSVEGIIDDVVH